MTFASYMDRADYPPFHDGVYFAIGYWTLFWVALGVLAWMLRKSR